MTDTSELRFRLSPSVARLVLDRSWATRTSGWRHLAAANRFSSAASLALAASPIGKAQEAWSKQLSAIYGFQQIAERWKPMTSAALLPLLSTSFSGVKWAQVLRMDRTLTLAALERIWAAADQLEASFDQVGSAVEEIAEVRTFDPIDDGSLVDVITGALLDLWAWMHTRQARGLAAGALLAVVYAWWFPLARARPDLVPTLGPLFSAVVTLLLTTALMGIRR